MLSSDPLGLQACDAGPTSNGQRCTQADDDDILERLKNFLLYGMFAGEDEVKAEEERRRQALRDLSIESGSTDGSLIIENLAGDWVRIQPDSLNRMNVFLWSGHAAQLQASGGVIEQLSPSELASVVPAGSISSTPDTRPRKPVNLPARNKVSVDMREVQTGHMAGGERAAQSAAAGRGKDIFPNSMTESQVRGSIMDAYMHSTVIRSQGQRVFLRGYTKDSMTIEMWLNKTTKVIETAWPK